MRCLIISIYVFYTLQNANVSRKVVYVMKKQDPVIASLDGLEKDAIEIQIKVV